VENTLGLRWENVEAGGRELVKRYDNIAKERFIQQTLD